MSFQALLSVTDGWCASTVAALVDSSLGLGIVRAGRWGRCEEEIPLLEHRHVTEYAATGKRRRTRANIFVVLYFAASTTTVATSSSYLYKGIIEGLVQSKKPKTDADK